tara:strand:+ start:2413 stop:2589 length:177 start_codon:yes stop_codon:yes gene_type:complete
MMASTPRERLNFLLSMCWEENGELLKEERVHLLDALKEHVPSELCRSKLEPVFDSKSS